LTDIPAAPSVRRLARENDVDLTTVKGSGPKGRITTEDIEEAAQTGKKSVPETSELPDFEQWGPVKREPMKNIRKRTAESMSEAWQTIPHVTQFDEADLTHLEEFRQQQKEAVKAGGGKLTITALLLKISAFALQKYPQFNASVDMKNVEIIFKNYYNIGVAVDTPQGLLVPVVRDVNRKSITELSVELTELAGKARDKKIPPDDLQGGNFTISNLGGIGGTAFTPIVYPPQVAILGVSAASYKQLFVEEAFRKRLVIPLSLSYDHRAIDGADGARFLRWICNVIENPFAILQ
jgi:pyruvate dehydrogenase E2 component (dihydrolipoamide acetyltransferase)